MNKKYRVTKLFNIKNIFLIFFLAFFNPFIQNSFAQINSSSIPQNSRVAAWEEDLLFLIKQIELIHPNPYHGLSRSEFQQAYTELNESLSNLEDDQIIVEMMRLFGMLASSGKEGHSGLYPQLVFGMVPIYLYQFEDGWFIVDANEDHADLIGARVNALGGTPIDDVVKAISPLIATDNDTNLLIKIPRFLVMPGLLSALYLSPDSHAISMDLIQANGASVSRTILTDNSWPYPFLPPEDEESLWLSNPSAAWWLRILDDETALYIQYNRTFELSAEGETLESLADRIISTFDNNELDRVVIDVRLNGGGDNTTFPPLITALKNHLGINRYGALYALIGRGTFSAAGNFITELEKETNVILVGEPTGGGPNQFGDVVNVELPNHPDLIIRLATLYHEFDSSNPDRLTHEPHLSLLLRSEDYFNRNDPILERALSHTP